MSPSNGLGIDNSTLAPLGPAAADPTSGNGDNGINSDNDVAFFATPGGKGTIAGITIASAVLLISFVLFFLWRKKKNDNDEGVYTAGGTRASASSFGDSSGDQGSPSQNAVANIPPTAIASAAPWDNEMAQVGTGPPGSFFVQRRSQPSSIRGTRTPPYPASAAQIDAALAARAISPLAMLQQRPEAFIPPPRTAGGQFSNEGHSGEGDPSSGSSAGHANAIDPFRDPSSTGHSQIGHDPNIVAAFATGDKHERRRSGYTSDTYRKSRSRPVSRLSFTFLQLTNQIAELTLLVSALYQLSVRNPDSDETRQEGVESLYIDRTPRSGSSDALYNVEDSQIPDSTGLEYYLGSAVPTPRTTTPSQATMMPPLPPVPANTMMYDFGEMPGTPRAAQEQTPWAAGHPSSQSQQQPYPQPEQAMPYGGLTDEQSGPSRALPEFEPQMTYAYPQPRPILSVGSSGNLSRPYLHHTSMQSTLQPPMQPAPGPLSTSSQAIHQGRTAPTAATPQTRQHRQSTVSSDGASSRSSIWRAWEHSNRSWVNEGFETPNDVQDVQLGSNANAVGGGNATAISGYFAWR